LITRTSDTDRIPWQELPKRLAALGGDRMSLFGSTDALGGAAPTGGIWPGASVLSRGATLKSVSTSLTGW